MDDVIKFSMSREYVPEWGISEALREIYQNFMDFGEYPEESVLMKNNYSFIEMRNDFSPSDLSFLKIGSSGKREDESAIGGKGEGLKLAMMVLLRNGFSSHIFFGNTMLSSTFYNDDLLGECFGLKVEGSKSDYKGFQVAFYCDTEKYKKYKENIVTEKDIIYKGYHGSLVNKKPGDVYVGGLFVSNVPSLAYAYDFKPEHCRLDRDRTVPNDWDVEWNASQIMVEWGKFKVSDFGKKDLLHVSSVSSQIAGEFSAVKVGTVIKLVSGETIASNNLSTALMKHPSIQKQIIKLSYTVSRKRTPHSLLQEFFNSHIKDSYNGKQKIEFQILLKKSKKWGIKNENN